MIMYQTPHRLNDYLNRTFSCDCGKEHFAPLKIVSVEKNALEDLPMVMKDLDKSRPFLICDDITYEIAGKKAMQILYDAGIQASIVRLTHMGFDEAALGELLINIPTDCDIIVAVGTGAINDLTRYFSFRMNRPFMTIATAAPMDGFASSIAAIYVNNLKTTFEAHTPLAIIADTEILKSAPYIMIAAGLGDLLGKSTALCDWKIAHIITGEHKCEKIIDLVEQNVKNVMEKADAAKDRDPQVLGNVMEGLVLTGVAMSLYGNSRPASGCEHHMSHYWETVFSHRGERPAPHGTQVGVATVLILAAVEELLEHKVDFDAARNAAKAYDSVRWECDIRMAYGTSASGIIQLEHIYKKNDSEARLDRIDVIESHWQEIRGLLKTLPPSKHVANLLKSLNSPFAPDQIGVDKVLLKNTFMYCKEVRPRYTILQMLWDLDLLDSVSEIVISKQGMD